MKELVKDTKIFEISAISDKLLAISIHVAVTVVGFFMARTSLWGGISPLGTALAAGVPIKFMPAAALGSLIGYILPWSDISAFRYAAALIAVTAIRFIISGIKPVYKNPLWSAIIASAVMSGVGIASAGTEFLTHGVLGIAEGLLAGGGAYFIRRATSYKLYARRGLHPEQTASLLISVNLVITSLFSVAVGGISLGKILAVILILLAAKNSGAAVSSICSVTSALAVCLSGGSIQEALTLCFTGLATGVFCGLGKIVVSLIPPAVSSIWVLVSSASAVSVGLFADTIIASVIFLIIPKNIGAKFKTLTTPPASTPDTDGLRRTLTMRLSFASAALHGISDTVEDVSRCLAISKKPSFAAVLTEVENDACRGCSFMLYCWEKKRKLTIDAVLGISEAIRRCQPISLADIPDEFAEKCLRRERFESSVARHYSDFLNNVAAEKRVSEMREVVSDQMNGIADMLSELSQEFKTAQKYDIAMATRVASALKELDLNANECSCVIDKFGRMTVEVKLSSIPEMPINRARILSRLEEICDREFEPPEINRQNKGCYITATEKALLSVDCFVTQFNQGKNQHCGDTCKYFFDGRGRLVVIVSDGMGSGGRAAVDSAMTAGLAERLIKAGFGYDCTLRLVNSAMLFKSSDESLATLDISCVDLYTGKTELLKAGAAPTLVRRNGRTGRAECKSLPAGILHEVGFDKATVTLKENDILIMMSDGACSEGSDWICAEIESWKGGGAKQLSEHIATAARRRRRDGHDDDITVFAAIIEKAV